MAVFLLHCVTGIPYNSFFTGSISKPQITRAYKRVRGRRSLITYKLFNLDDRHDLRVPTNLLRFITSPVFNKRNWNVFKNELFKLLNVTHLRNEKEERQLGENLYNFLGVLVSLQKCEIFDVGTGIGSFVMALICLKYTGMPPRCMSLLRQPYIYRVYPRLTHYCYIVALSRVGFNFNVTTEAIGREALAEQNVANKEQHLSR